MDCLEFRRRLGSDPRVADADARAHLESCPRCRDAYARAQAFESRLAEALTVAVPEGLADRVLLTQITQERRRRRTSLRYGWIALAAAAALIVAVGVVRRGALTAKPLPDVVVAHIEGAEKPALSLRAPVPADQVRKAFTDRGVALASVPDGISYVQECPVGAYRSVHMIMPRDDKPITVFYLVNYQAPAVVSFKRDAMIGREVPIGNGTLVMVANDPDHFDALEHGWRDALQGTAETAAGSR